MLTLGQNLYILTNRDEATLYVDSYFRQSLFTQPIGTSVSNDTVGLEIPLDRSLYLSCATIIAAPGAGNSVQALGIRAVSASGIEYPLFQQNGSSLNGDNVTGAAGGTIAMWRSFNLVLPPSTRRIVATLARTGSLNAATVDVFVCGYLIPPGGLGRLA
jgi:hypothetical protein